MHSVTAPEIKPKRIVNAEVYPICVFNDGLNEICIDTTVEVKAGWEFTQAYSIYTGKTAAGGTNGVS